MNLARTDKKRQLTHFSSIFCIFIACESLSPDASHNILYIILGYHSPQPYETLARLSESVSSYSSSLCFFHTSQHAVVTIPCLACSMLFCFPIWNGTFTIVFLFSSFSLNLYLHPFAVNVRISVFLMAE